MQHDKKLLEITNNIHIIRDQKVMLGRDLAVLYGVEVKALNQAVKRNTKRFPDDFMFQLTSNELEVLRSQFVTANHLTPRNHMSRSLPYAFTEAGSFLVLFLASKKESK